MANQTIFKRYEYKYLLTADQKKDLQAYMETYMKPDTFGRNTICNLYFDTPDYLLIRRSIEGKVYKEKIRLRTYGRAQDDSEAFIELKKKLKDGTFTIDFCDDSLHTNGNLSICGGTRFTSKLCVSWLLNIRQRKLVKRSVSCTAGTTKMTN